jgi:hypothetical protein
MLSDIWINFSVVVFVQFSLFFITALYYKKLKEIPLILLYSIIIGTFVGLLYDLMLGKYLGLVSYSFGFVIPHLLLNASVSYGLFVASVLLLQSIRILNFVTWIGIIVIIYEITNLYFPVWTYEFSLPLLPFFILCLIGYSSGALLASAIAHLIFKHPFALKLETRKR